MLNNIKINNNLAENIKKYRNKKNISIRKLSQMTNISETSLKRIEKCEVLNIDIKKIIEICKALETDLNTLSYENLTVLRVENNKIINDIKKELTFLSNVQIDLCIKIIKNFLN